MKKMSSQLYWIERLQLWVIQMQKGILGLVEVLIMDALGLYDKFHYSMFLKSLGA